MADADLARLRKLCLELPGTRETLTWGHPNFRVGDKIFASYGDDEDGTGGKTYSFYFAYDADNGGQVSLRLSTLTWDDDGWPRSAGP